MNCDGIVQVYFAGYIDGAKKKVFSKPLIKKIQLAFNKRYFSEESGIEVSNIKKKVLKKRGPKPKK